MSEFKIPFGGRAHNYTEEEIEWDWTQGPCAGRIRKVQPPPSHNDETLEFYDANASFMNVSLDSTQSTDALGHKKNKKNTKNIRTKKKMAIIAAKNEALEKQRDEAIEKLDQKVKEENRKKELEERERYTLKLENDHLKANLHKIANSKNPSRDQIPPPYREIRFVKSPNTAEFVVVPEHIHGGSSVPGAVAGQLIRNNSTRRPIIRPPPLRPQPRPQTQPPRLPSTQNTYNSNAQLNPQSNAESRHSNVKELDSVQPKSIRDYAPGEGSIAQFHHDKVIIFRLI